MAEPQVRLRQAVLVAEQLEPLAGELREALALGEPFRDPGVAEFGLQNAVFAIGDCFLEIVSPVREGTAAGRYLERHGGDGGYMAIFDLEDLDAARRRAAQAGVRVVWQIDLPDISGTHLHPADLRGAIVSLDQSRPYGTWRWGGPQWTGRTGEGAPGRLAGISVAVAEPRAVAERWAQLLGVALADRPVPSAQLKDGQVQFIDAPEQPGEGIAEIVLAGPRGALAAGHSIELGGVRLRAMADDRVGA